MPSHRTPRLIYFDLGDVLLHFDHRIACRSIATMVGLNEQRVWDAIFASGLEHQAERGEITRQQFHAAFCQATGTRPDEAAFYRAHGAIFWRNVSITPIVAQLALAGYRLGILSNTCDAHWEYVASGRYSLIPAAFSVLALSYELKAMKPARPIYDRAAQLAGVPPGEIFFVDDRPENVAGAIEAGYDAVPYTTAADLAEQLRLRGVEFNY